MMFIGDVAGQAVPRDPQDVLVFLVGLLQQLVFHKEGEWLWILIKRKFIQVQTSNLTAHFHNMSQPVSVFQGQRPEPTNKGEG